MFVVNCVSSALCGRLVIEEGLVETDLGTTKSGLGSEAVCGAIRSLQELQLHLVKQLPLFVAMTTVTLNATDTR